MKKIVNYTLGGLVSISSAYALDVQGSPEPPIEQTTGILESTLQFIVQYWVLMVFFLLLMIVFIIIYYFMKKSGDMFRERDEAGFLVYNNIKNSCIQQAKSKKIRLMYSMTNILWGGIPLKWNEMSAKVFDIKGDLIGYYRGESPNMVDNTMNFLLYKTKKFFFFEEKFIFKVPMSIRANVKKEVTNKDNKKVIKKENMFLSYASLVEELPNGDLRVKCYGIQKLAYYYYVPVFVVDDVEGFSNFSKYLDQGVAEQAFEVLLHKEINVFGRSVERAGDMNPSKAVRGDSKVKRENEQPDVSENR